MAPKKPATKTTAIEIPASPEAGSTRPVDPMVQQMEMVLFAGVGREAASQATHMLAGIARQTGTPWFVRYDETDKENKPTGRGGVVMATMGTVEQLNAAEKALAEIFGWAQV